MCQNKKDGGKRCQVHQPEVQTILKHVQQEYNLPRDSIITAFQELRQESKTINIPHDIITQHLQETVNMMMTPDPTLTDVTQQFLNGEYEHLDSHSLYAITNIYDHASEMEVALDGFTSDIANQTNSSAQEVMQEYVAIARDNANAQQSDLYTSSNYRKYEAANLPHDRNSIIAMESLVRSAQDSLTRSVAHENINHEQISSLGYDSALKRLEIAYKGLPDVVAYKNVTPEQFSTLSDVSNNPSIYLNEHIRNNNHQLYATPEEAQAGALAQQCTTCGQFIGPAHDCEQSERNWKHIDINNTRGSQKANNIVSLSRLSQVANSDEHKAILRDLLHKTHVASPPLPLIIAKLESGNEYSFASTTLINAVDEPLVTGDINVRADGHTLIVDSSNLRCSCGRFMSTNGCNHVLVTKAAYESVIDQAEESLHGAIIEKELFDDHTAALMIEYEDHIQINEIADGIFYDNLIKGKRMSAQQVQDMAEDQYAETQALLMEEYLSEAETEESLQKIQDEEDDLLYPDRVSAAQSAWDEMKASWVQKNQDYYEDRNEYIDYRESLLERPEMGYDGETQKLNSTIEQAQARKNNGEPVLEPLTSNVTDGICDPSIPGSRRFGVELEFSFPRNYTAEMRSQKMELIVRDLKHAGLTSQDQVLPYHAAQESNWGEWSLENDLTVAGELVSPILADTPESWEQMGKALEILKRHGAKTDQSTGAHVNISTGSYLGSSAKHTELIRTVKQHEAVLYRAAADPATGTHRQTEFCAPNVAAPRVPIHEFDPSIPEGGMSVDNYGRGQAINLTNSTLSTQARAEFRLWDGSLDLATLQTQIAASAALVDHAEMNVEEYGVSRPREAVESLHVQETAYLGDLSSVEGKALYNLSDFVDTVFRRQSDRERFVSLFAVNEWVTNY